MTAFSRLCRGVLAALLLAAPASAMDFIVERVPGMTEMIVRIRAEGLIVPDDQYKLLNAILEAQQPGPNGERAEMYPPVYFNSPGGEPETAVMMGYIIRKFELNTFVPKDADCSSACTFSFLGGVRRMIMGTYGIHSGALGSTEGMSAEDIRGSNDYFQAISAMLISYSQEMIGSTDMMLYALSYGSGDPILVGDDLLGEWSIITEAFRPSQRLQVAEGTLSHCGDMDWIRVNVIPRLNLCEDLVVGRDYLAIQRLVEDLRGKPLAGDIDAEQERFEKAWEGCVVSEFPDPNFQLIRKPSEQWARENASCLKDVVSARRRELQALADYYAVIESEPALSGWK